jgi:TATA-box binding protein (TBP) (component of TFIID and TFIIIB)
MVKFKVVRLCKEDAMTIVPTNMARYDLEKAAGLLREAGYEVDDKGVMVTAASERREITLYPSGRMVVAGIDGKEEAGQVAEATYSVLDPARE